MLQQTIFEYAIKAKERNDDMIKDNKSEEFEYYRLHDNTHLFNKYNSMINSSLLSQAENW